MFECFLETIDIYNIFQRFELIRNFVDELRYGNNTIHYYIIRCYTQNGIYIVSKFNCRSVGQPLNSIIRNVIITTSRCSICSRGKFDSGSLKQELDRYLIKILFLVLFALCKNIHYRINKYSS